MTRTRQSSMDRYRPDELEGFIVAVLSRLGSPDVVASEVASHLVCSSVSGHDSHGVNRLPQYVMQADSGNVDPAAVPTVLKETASSVLIDGHGGFGHRSSAVALDHAMTRAAANGVGVATVRHATHIGRLGEYAERAAERGLVSMITTGAAGLDLGWMMPPGGARRFVGANPWALGIPSNGAPVIFDGSMTNVAQGKVHVARSKGQQIPDEWLVDPEGRPTNDPADLYAGGALLPLGGSIAGHKGYSLGLMSALLGAMGMINDPDPTPVGANVQVTGEKPPVREGATHWLAGVFILVVDPAAFGDAEEYAAEVEHLRLAARGAAGSPEAPVFPGELEVRSRQRVLAEGLIIPGRTVDELAEVGRRFSVPFPESLTTDEGER